jgi:hypothetical protein
LLPVHVDEVDAAFCFGTCECHQMLAKTTFGVVYQLIWTRILTQDFPHPYLLAIINRRDQRSNITKRSVVYTGKVGLSTLRTFGCVQLIPVGGGADLRLCKLTCALGCVPWCIWLCILGHSVVYTRTYRWRHSVVYTGACNL